MAAPAKPSERYETALREGRISEDRAQRVALEKLDALADALALLRQREVFSIGCAFVGARAGHRSRASTLGRGGER